MPTDHKGTDSKYFRTGTSLFSFLPTSRLCVCQHKTQPFMLQIVLTFRYQPVFVIVYDVIFATRINHALQENDNKEDVIVVLVEQM
jgi:hypothetical protein